MAPVPAIPLQVAQSGLRGVSWGRGGLTFIFITMIYDDFFWLQQVTAEAALHP